MSTVLVVGAQRNSLGWFVKRALLELGYYVVTAGISGDENYVLDIARPSTFGRVLRAEPFEHVIVTAGINRAKKDFDSGHDWMMKHMEVNAYGPISLLHKWLNVKPVTRGHFVAISSNSAFIPRRNSMAYCASKAALSMSIRVAAREEAMGDQRAIIYGYEPGLLIGTPMTESTEKRFGTSATRIPGSPHGLQVDDVAYQIASTLHVGGRALNGVLVRLDGGEQ